LPDTVRAAAWFAAIATSAGRHTRINRFILFNLILLVPISASLFSSPLKTGAVVNHGYSSGSHLVLGVGTGRLESADVRIARLRRRHSTPPLRPAKFS
jgi:hypothetical protein